MTPGQSTNTLRILPSWIMAAIAVLAIGYSLTLRADQINDNSDDIRELQDTVSTDHDILIEIQTDVGWLRKRLQEKLAKELLRPDHTASH